MMKVLIEAEAGSCEKHRYDERTLEHVGVGKAAREYPYPYGFIVGTRAADGDCVDCYVITEERLRPGDLVACEPVGLLEQFEGEEIDHKVLAVVAGRERGVGPGLRDELETFIHAVFAAYPDVRVRVGRLLPREAAVEHVEALGFPDGTR